MLSKYIEQVIRVAAEQQVDSVKAADSPQAQGNSRFFFLVIVFMFWFSSYIYVPVLSPYVEQLGPRILWWAWCLAYTG